MLHPLNKSNFLLTQKAQLKLYFSKHGFTLDKVKKYKCVTYEWNHVKNKLMKINTLTISFLCENRKMNIIFMCF